VTERFDAVVVGAGPNGLVAAITMAQAGRSVLVLEASATVGGGCRSAELTEPGFVHDVCAAVHPLAVASPAIVGLGLEAHGVRFAHPEIALAHPLDGGRAGLLHRSIDETCDGLGVDGDRWRRLIGPMVDRWPQLSPQLLAPIVSVPRHPFALASFGVRALPPATMADRWFRTDEAAGLFAGSAAHAFLPLQRPLTSAFGVLLSAAAHAVGWPVVEGGSQRLADAMAARLVELGGEIRTGERVRSMDDLPPHDVALFDTDPGQLAAIAGDRLSPGFVKRMRRFRHGPAAFKLDYALSAPVPWANEGCRRAGTVHLGGTLAEVAAAERDVSRGRLPDRPFVLAVQPGVADPSRAPAGKHTLWVYAHVPAGCTEDPTERIERQIERFAPGFRDTVIARNAIGPAAWEAYNPNYVGGDISGGAHTGLQLVFRPVIGRPYATSDPRIVLCSASTPPGAGVHGMCGYHAARSVLRR